MGRIADNPDQLLLQLQAYAACGDDPGIQASVRRNYARLVELSGELTGVADDEELDGFFQIGMWCNVAAALGVEDFSVGSGWVESSLAATRSPRARSSGNVSVTPRC